MLSSRYLQLHQALGLGPMWLKNTAYIISPNNEDTTQTYPNQQIPKTHQAADSSSQSNIQTPIKPAHTTPEQTTQPSHLTPIHIAPIESPIQVADWATLQSAIHNCKRCTLHNHRRQAIVGYGAQNASLLVVSPNPSPEDDNHNQLFSGEIGVLLSNIFAAIHIPKEHIYFTSLVKCSPRIQLNTSLEQQQQCSNFLHAQIQLIAPKAILFLGSINSEIIHSYLNNQPYFNIPHPARMLRHSQLKAQAWIELKKLAAYLQQKNPS